MMKPNPDWLDDLVDDLEKLTTIRQTVKRRIAKTIAVTYIKTSYMALALPLFNVAVLSEHPVIKLAPQMRDTLILSTNVSTISPSPVIEAQTYYTTTGDKGFSGWY